MGAAGRRSATRATADDDDVMADAAGSINPRHPAGLTPEEALARGRSRRRALAAEMAA